MIFTRRIQTKAIESERDLELARLAVSPVLGTDPWYGCVWYAIWRLVTVHLLTPAGAWALSTSVMGYELTVKALEVPNGPSESVKWLLCGFGAHAVLAWLWLCAREEARNLLRAVAERVRVQVKPTVN